MRGADVLDSGGRGLRVGLCSIGLIVNVIAMSGVGNTFSLMITQWAGDSLLIAIVLVALAFACLFLSTIHAVWALPLAIFALRLGGQGMASHIASPSRTNRKTATAKAPNATAGRIRIRK